MGGDTLVPPGSAVHREFTRLYEVVRRLRPPAVDRWSGVLRAIETAPGEIPQWGAFNPKSGDIRLSAHLVLPYLTGSLSPADRRAQGHALATVLHEATHAGMLTDAPTEPNAVRSEHSLGATEGFAEYRALHDFEAFTIVAGYQGAIVSEPQYQGAYTAMAGVVELASGPYKDKDAFVAEAVRGPSTMHFDQLADGVLRNRLGDVVPLRTEDRTAVRAALIGELLNWRWSSIAKDQPAEAGHRLTNEVRQGLNIKIEEIRRHYLAHPHQVFPAEGPNAAAARAAEDNKLATLPPPDPNSRVKEATQGGLTTSTHAPNNMAPMRFLDGVAPAAGATARRPSLGQGARGAGQGGKGRRPESGVERE